MRGRLAGQEPALRNPASVTDHVPGIYLDDPLFAQVCGALDDVLAATVVALDCFPAYLDPRLTPDDFLPWLAGWVGAEPARSVVPTAVAAYGGRGTAAALRAAAAALAGVLLEAVQVDDPGRVAWSVTPGAAIRPPVGPVVVRVMVGPHIDRPEMAARLERQLADRVPVHCRLRVEVNAP